MVRCGKISRRCFVYDKDSKIPYRNGDDPCIRRSASAATFINIGTGSTGGTYYPVGAGMAKVWNSAIPGMKANAQSTGGTAQNLALLGKGEAEVIFADGLYFFAYEGKGTFEGKPMKELRGLVPLAEPIHFLVARAATSNRSRILGQEGSLSEQSEANK